MAWLKGFTYDGIESLDYDLYITSGSVYDAPERVVDMIKVPGRNGNLAIDRGKFENIDVEYNVYTKDRSQTSFAQNIRDFRNELCSRHEYLRLTDDYNSDEFRLGIYKSGLELDADIDRAGAIKLTFDCKPQRFLTSGETERSIPEWSDVHTDSGSLVTVNNSGGEYAVKSLSVDIVPQQSGSGDPSPTNIRPITGFDSVTVWRTGKNLLPPYSTSGGTSTSNGITFTYNSNGSITASGTATANALAGSPSGFRLPPGTYKKNAYDSTKKVGLFVQKKVTSSNWVTIGVTTSDTFTLTEEDAQYELAVRIRVESGATLNSYNYTPIIRLPDTTDASELYNGNTYTVSLSSAGTVYGGTLDVVSGQLTVTHKIISENDFYAVSSGTSGGGLHYANVNSSEYPAATSSNSLSNMLVNNQSGWSSTTPCFTTNTSGNPVRVYGVFTTLAEFKTAYAGLQIVYELATPLTYQLTATQVALLLGTNNVWSNTGDIQIEYGKGGNTLYNPTPFDSLPLIKVTGTGTLGIGDWILTITGLSSQTLYIDCEMMEVYKNTGGIIEGANSLVSINKNTFPKLLSGMNNITKTSGLTNLKITPRWWRV